MQHDQAFREWAAAKKIRVWCEHSYSHAFFDALHSYYSQMSPEWPEAVSASSLHT